MTAIPDPRALVRQAQLQTQANRYALLIRQANQRLLTNVKQGY
jgi:hypothetical protein